MRFIFNFIFFGILFYALWFFFPDAFAKLVAGAGTVFTFIKDVITNIIDKLHPSKPGPTAPEHAAAWLLMELQCFDIFFKRR